MGHHWHPMLFWPKIDSLDGVSMVAIKSYSDRSVQHRFPKAQTPKRTHSAIKIHGL